MSDYPMLISNKLHSFRNFGFTKLHFFSLKHRIDKLLKRCFVLLDKSLMIAGLASCDVMLEVIHFADDGQMIAGFDDSVSVRIPARLSLK